MPILDHNLWLDGSGAAQNGTEVITDGVHSTTVTGTFVGGLDNEDAAGTGDDLTANFTSTPMVATFDFSTTAENLSFSLNGLNQAPPDFDDFWFVEALDENGDPVDPNLILAGITGNLGLFDFQIVGNQVRIDADSGTATDLNLVMPGRISQLTLTADNGPDGTQSGGSGISDFTFDVTCFARGTKILTDRGEIEVENLRSGDKVTTFGNDNREIRWIGSRKVKAEGKFAPITIKKGALGNFEDLSVSPQHRMLVKGWRAELLFGDNEVLVAAKHLINGESIYIKEGGDIEYFHILFDRHEIIYSNGALSESFHPNDVGLRGLEDKTRKEVFELFPELEADASSYGPTARTALKAFEAKALADNPEFLK